MHDHDEISNESGNQLFGDIVKARATRRGFVVGSLGAAALTFVSASQAQANPNKGPGNNSGKGNASPTPTT